MPINYLDTFPVRQKLLPEKLRRLLSPIGLDPQERVEISALSEYSDVSGRRKEVVHLVMAAVPEAAVDTLEVLEAGSNGVVSYSVPMLREKGNCAEFAPSVSGHDYIVASWGDGSSYTYSLAEKVWMALGLVASCIGNNEQRLVYDDLGLPEFGVAEGEISANYRGEVSRNVIWLMSNEYLRKYLWMRGAVGVRSFYYSAVLPDTPELVALMADKEYIDLKAEGNWCDGDIRRDERGLLLQVWATVAAVSCEQCLEQTAEGLEWPGLDGPMTHARANAQLHGGSIYLDDRFLERYEQSSFYESMPDRYGDTSPSYRGQWAFSDCVRVGRNLIRVPIRELYKPKPDREIVHAHRWVVDEGRVAGTGLAEEHVVAKTKRLLDQILDLGDRLSKLGEAAGIPREATELVGFSRAEIEANWWTTYPQLCRLAQVAPLSMTQQAFLARCKSLHEVWQRVPDGFMRQLLRKAGCPAEKVKELGSLKLLQGLLNIVEHLNTQQESVEAFVRDAEPETWPEKNDRMAPLFLTNDLRIADAHESFGRALVTLQALGFDTGTVNQGYGRALDFVFDGVIGAFVAVNGSIERLLAR